jgi:chromosome segregation ATPase
MATGIQTPSDEGGLQEQIAAMRAEMRARFDANDAKWAANDARWTANETRWAAAEARADARHEAIMASIAAMQTSIAVMLERLTTVEIEVRQIKIELKEMKVEIKDFQAVPQKSSSQFAGVHAAIAQSESRQTKWYMATTAAFMVLYAGLMVHNQRSFDSAMTMHMQNAHHVRP